MKGHWIRYSPRELAFIKRRRKLPRRALRAAFLKAFKRREVSVDDLKALCSRKGWQTGRNGRFGKGHLPANKGKKMPYNANSARTQFKKGNIGPRVKYAGHERVSKDGYVEISVAQTNPHTGYERRYVLKHRWLWEQKHGAVPQGMCLKCKGDRLNTDPSNWQLVPRSLLPRLAGRRGRRYDDAPDELKPTIMAVAKLEQQLYEKSRRAV